MDNRELMKKLLYTKPKINNFSFDLLHAPGIYQLLTTTDVFDLHHIATSIKYSSKINKKYKLIDDLMKQRGFRKLGAGTNRVVYKFLEDQSFVAKIAIDTVGMSDNPNEFKNQWLINPYCTRIFEVDQTGVIAIAERVEAIQSVQEYIYYAEDIYALLNHLTGKYVLEDIGCKFFRNIGIRTSAEFGPVLLDFPYLYELDGDKLYCNRSMDDGTVCYGEIDYDDGFNFLVCKKCGKIYRARDLKKDNPEESGIITMKGFDTMKIELKRGNNVINVVDTSRKSKTIGKAEPSQFKRKNLTQKMEVTLQGFNVKNSDNDEIPQTESDDSSTELINSSENNYSSMIPESDPYLNDNIDESMMIVNSDDSIDDENIETDKELITPINEESINQIIDDDNSNDYDINHEIGTSIAQAIMEATATLSDDEVEFDTNTGFINETVDEDFPDQNQIDDSIIESSKNNKHLSEKYNYDFYNKNYPVSVKKFRKRK